MDLKNTAILFMFLLCILGLIMGACVTDDNGNFKSPDDDEKVINHDLNESKTIKIIIKENESNVST